MNLLRGHGISKAQRDLKRAELATDKLIEKSYYQQAAGRQIDIMKIGELFRDARQLIAEGNTVEISVKLAIEKYCEPVKV